MLQTWQLAYATARNSPVCKNEKKNEKKKIEGQTLTLIYNMHSTP